ncbi:MAG: hypothetical protein CME59_07005 [Halioglobus sp.]|nr:hypothetical protein [Halioglobus sp.]|tara:strand:- start:1654 stop:3162 length:1509 start_codon:yes stop_codon:yes gene_type:complete
MKLVQTLLISTCIAYLCVAPTTHAHEIINTAHGDVFVITYKEYVNRNKNGIDCGKLPRVIAYKGFQSQDNENFTEAEYQALAGDAPYLGLRSADFWYSKARRKLVSWDELFAVYGSSHSGGWDHLPVLCGVRTAQGKIREASANPVISWKNGEASCSGAFCKLPGGAYLHAVYQNDIELVKRFDSSIDNTVRKKLGAILSLSRDMGREPQDFSLLPALANAYLAARTSEVSGSCADDLVRKTVIRKTPTYDMFDADGLYEGQGGGEVYRFTYVLKPALVPLCDSVCDHLGGRSERSALASLGHGGANLTLSGVQELVDAHACLSSESTQFERNLASMTALYLEQKYQWLPRPAAPAPASRDARQDSAEEQAGVAAANREAGARYRQAISAQGNVSQTASGLQYTILAMGGGRHPLPTDRVTIVGVGKLVDGRHMDDSYAAGPTEVSMSSLLPGVAEGLQLIKPGGKIHLTLPPELGFGDRKAGMVKPGSTLIYELELVSIVD